MKKRFLFIISILLIALIFTVSCEEKETKDITNEIREKVDNKIDAYKTDLLDSEEIMDSNDKYAEYLQNWAKSKGIRTRLEDGIVTLLIDSNEEYKDAKPTVIVCPYDHKQFKETVEPVVMTLYCAKNNENTGALTAIFVPEDGHDFSSVKKIKKKYIKKNANVICLNGDENGLVASTTGASSLYRFTKRPKTSAPATNKAYVIALKGFPGGQTNNKVNNTPNPIVELDSFLANLKKSGIDYEIISFRSGDEDPLVPSSAVVKIAIHSDHQSKFETKLEQKKEQYEKRASKDDERVFAYRETKLPGKVIDQKSSSNLVSFIYTLLKGEYYRDEDTDILVAVNNITYISADTKKIEIGSCAYSIDDAILKEIDEAEETLAGLSGFRFKKTFSSPKWVIKDDSVLIESISSAYKKSTGKKLKTKSSVTPTNASYIEEINDKCDVVSITISENSVKDLSTTMVNYLLDL